MNEKIICPYCKEEVIIPSGTLLDLAYGYEKYEQCYHCGKEFYISATIMFNTEEVK